VGRPAPQGPRLPRLATNGRALGELGIVKVVQVSAPKGHFATPATLNRESIGPAQAPDERPDHFPLGGRDGRRVVGELA
jgi:hypothetical protein